MLIRNFTFPGEEPAFQQLFDRIRSETGAKSGTWALPFSPLQGTGDAGRLAVQAGRAAGYGWIRKQTGKRALVEIDALAGDKTAVFGPLLEACRALALEWEVRRLVAYVSGVDEILTGAYRNAGFDPRGSVHELRMDLSGERPPSAVPDGYFLKPFHEFRHLPTLAATLHRAYHDKFSRPEYETDGVTVDTVRAEIEAHPEAEIERDYFTMLNFLGKGVAVVRSRGHDWIDGPGVVPEERENGLHLPLLTAAMQHLESRGSRAVRLMAFDDDPSRIDEYRRIGFDLEATKTCWQMKIS
ncbi:MAG TPA: hypothetical protein VMN57_15595 [Anaerolineales bacterium]|nr:hypothetical protein [Anaerolineales bacterium]